MLRLIAGMQPLLRFEPDRQIAIGGSSVLHPQVPGALRNFIVKGFACFAGWTGARRVCFLHGEKLRWWILPEGAVSRPFRTHAIMPDKRGRNHGDISYQGTCRALPAGS